MRRSMIGLAIVFLAALASGAFAGDAPVRVFVNGERAKIDPPAVIRDGKAYVSILGVSRALSAKVQWLDDSRTAVITVGNKRTKHRQSDAIVIDDLPYLPLRTIGEAVGCSVEWDSNLRAVKVTSEAAPPNCYG